MVCLCKSKNLFQRRHTIFKPISIEANTLDDSIGRTNLPKF